ncbi:MAG: YbaK/EbsC family protein [Pseudomonadales bacterium]|nr:YbaK/EbsC family protein [Pseudomonadales bacterium]
MASVISMQAFLQSKGISFETVTHKHTDSSINTAHAAHIPTAQLAKAVVLKNTLNHPVMAVLPANKKLLVSALNDFTYSDFQILDEQSLTEFFADCEAGVAPSMGSRYGMQMIVDEGLLEENTVYLEAGDHCHVLKLAQQDYLNLVMSSRHATIAETAIQSQPPQSCAVFA